MEKAAKAGAGKKRTGRVDGMRRAFGIASPARRHEKARIRARGCGPCLRMVSAEL